MKNKMLLKVGCVNFQLHVFLKLKFKTKLNAANYLVSCVLFRIMFFRTVLPEIKSWQ